MQTNELQINMREKNKKKNERRRSVNALPPVHKLHSTDYKRCSDTDGKIATQCAQRCTCWLAMVVESNAGNSMSSPFLLFTISLNWAGECQWIVIIMNAQDTLEFIHEKNNNI